MDFAKLALAAQIRSEILERLGTTSIHQTDNRVAMLHADTVEGCFHDILSEIEEVAKRLDTWAKS